MVKKRDGKRVDTGKKKENGAPIYNWIKNDDTSTMDNDDVKNVRNDFQVDDVEKDDSSLPMETAEMEMSELPCPEGQGFKSPTHHDKVS